jgi:V8-like Glu-specific endopeptidase
MVITRTIVVDRDIQATRVTESIVRVSTVPAGDDKGVYLATAWAIDKDHLMTAGHFCSNAADMQTLGKAKKELRLDQVDSQGAPYNSFGAKIVAWVNKGMDDMCILKSPNHGLPVLEIEPDLDLVQTEDPIIVVGSPRGFFPLRRDGYVGSVAEDGVVLSVEIQPGNSGGPVVWQGKVIGMIILSMGDLHEAGVAVRSDKLLPFIHKHIK